MKCPGAGFPMSEPAMKEKYFSPASPDHSQLSCTRSQTRHLALVKHTTATTLAPRRFQAAKHHADPDRSRRGPFQRDPALETHRKLQVRSPSSDPVAGSSANSPHRIPQDTDADERLSQLEERLSRLQRGVDMLKQGAKRVDTLQAEVSGLKQQLAAKDEPISDKDAVVGESVLVRRCRR